MISREIRYRAVVHYSHFDRSLRRVSALYGVSKSSLQRWVKSGGHDHAKRFRKSAFTRVQEFIRAHLQQHPFTTMADLSLAIQRGCGVKLGRSTVGAYSKRAGFTRKKAFRVVDAVHDPESVSSFCRRHLDTSPEQLVCIDEAGFHIGDHPRMGYAAVGRRLNILQSRTLRRSKLTVLMAIKTTGVVHFKVLDHNCRKPDFVDFITSMPVSPGHTLLMDNIAFHKSADTVQAIKDKGCSQLFIPPYSPRFNAIENVFGVMKNAYRRAIHLSPPTASSHDVCQTLKAVLSTFQKSDLTAFFERARRQSQQALADLDHSTFHGYEK